RRTLSPVRTGCRLSAWSVFGSSRPSHANSVTAAGPWSTLSRSDLNHPAPTSGRAARERLLLFLRISLPAMSEHFRARAILAGAALAETPVELPLLIVTFRMKQKLNNQAISQPGSRPVLNPQPAFLTLLPPPLILSLP